MTSSFTMKPSGPFEVTVLVPGSKSLAIRALLASSLARGDSRLVGDVRVRDVEVVAAALRALGVTVSEPDEHGIDVQGADGRFPAPLAEIDLEDCGTGARLLAAAAAFAGRTVRLDGSARLRSRPFGPLLSVLSDLGARIRSAGRLPLTIEGIAPPRDAIAVVPGDLSSQFVSALLLVGPLGGLEVQVSGELVSRPYVDLTVAVMEAFGARVDRAEADRFRVERTGYEGTTYEIEGDASSAAFWLGAAAVSGGAVRVANVDPGSAQPDVAVLGHLAALGCEIDDSGPGLAVRGPARRGADLDVRHSPDLMPVLAAVAATVPERTRIHGAPHLVLKESDRIAAMAAALSALGARVEPRDDGLEVVGGGLHGGEIDPRGDHRIAMASGILGLTVPGVVIHDPDCTAKSYPGFLELLADAAGVA